MTVRLLCFALLLVARSALAVPPRDFHVFAYDLDLVIDRAHHRLSGRERLHLRNDIRGLTTLVFPGHGISVRSVTSQDGAPLAYSTAHDEIRIHPPNSFAEGDTLAFTIQYKTSRRRLPSRLHLFEFLHQPLDGVSRSS